MIKLTFYTETSLPQSLSPTSIYYIKASGNSKATCYITDSGGNAYPLTITESFVKSINESVTPDTTGNLSLALSMDNSGNLGITGNQSTVNLDVRFRKNSDKVNFITDLSAKPSTLSGYGITDAVNVSQLSDIESANIIGVATPTTNPGTPTANVGYNVSNLSLTSTLTYPNFTVKDPISGNLVQFVQPINSSGVIRYSTTLGYWEYAPQAFDKSGLAVTGNINTLAPQLTTAGKYISSDDGSQPSASGYNVLTTPMNVTPGQSISFSGASYQQYAFYKSDGTFLSGYNGNPIKNTVIVPANAAFFNYTIIDADLPTLSVVVSNVAPPRGLPFAKSLNPQYSDGTMLLNPDAVISAAKSNLNETILTYNDSTNFDYWPVPISVNGKLLAIVASIKELCREVNKYLKKEVLLPSSERGYINTNPTRYSIWAENYTIVTYLLHDSSVCDLTTCTRATSWANIDKERFYWASNADIQQTVKYGQIKFGSTVLFDGGTKNFLAHSSAEAWFNVKPILQNPELKKRLGKILCLDESVSGFPSSGIALQMLQLPGDPAITTSFVLYQKLSNSNSPNQFTVAYYDEYSDSGQFQSNITVPINNFNGYRNGLSYSALTTIYDAGWEELEDTTAFKVVPKDANCLNIIGNTSDSSKISFSGGTIIVNAGATKFVCNPSVSVLTAPSMDSFRISLRVQINSTSGTAIINAGINSDVQNMLSQLTISGNIGQHIGVNQSLSAGSVISDNSITADSFSVNNGDILRLTYEVRREKVTYYAMNETSGQRSECDSTNPYPGIQYITTNFQNVNCNILGYECDVLDRRFPKVVTIIDSISKGAGVTPDTRFIGKIEKILGVPCYPVAASGYSISFYITNNFLAQNLAIVRPEVIIDLAGTNDLSTGMTPSAFQTIKGQLQSIIKAYGQYIHMCTLLPTNRWDVTGANNVIVNNFVTGNSFSDLYAMLYDLNSPPNSDVTYFQREVFQGTPNHTHPNESGCELISGRLLRDMSAAGYFKNL